MKGYLDSAHMEAIPSDKILSHTSSYYIPHHCIAKADYSKFRVVFDASCKTSNDLSLNDCLLPDPKLQQDIISILLKFRLHTVCFTADIKQMFRQILISEKHRHF